MQKLDGWVSRLEIGPWLRGLGLLGFLNLGFRV